MEMSFPLLANQFGASAMRPDFRALLSSAISRQAESPTARAMVNAIRNPQISCESLDMMGKRIEYFAGKRKSSGAENEAFGSFARKDDAAADYPLENERAVYQDGLANRKHMGIISDLSEMLAIHPGQETLRNL